MLCKLSFKIVKIFATHRAAGLGWVHANFAREITRQRTAKVLYKTHPNFVRFVQNFHPTKGRQMTQIAPFMSSLMEVEKDWIDYNGHLNMAYYSVLFDRGIDHAYPYFGYGETVAVERGLTTYTADFRISYIRELHVGQRVRCSTQLIEIDRKRFHTYQELFHEDGWLAATAEALTLHIDMTGPRVAEMPDDIYDKLSAIAALHAQLPRPERLGRPIGIPRKP
jgi:acyl-CoA thioester hydrolase